MKLTVKPLKGESFDVEINPEEKVEELKKKITAIKPEYPADSTKLIYSGKIMQDDQPVGEYGIKEGEFVVVMASKPKPAAPAPAPAPEPTATPAPAATPAATPDAAPAAGGAPAGDVPVSYDTAASALVTGSQMDPIVQQLCDMGFERPQVERCLRAAFNNPDRAVEYLTTGIPEGLMPQAPAPGAGGAGVPPPAGGAPAPTPGATAPTGGPGGATPFPAMPTGGPGGATPFPAMGGMGGGGGGGGGGSAAALQELRNHPRFRELAALVASNPAMLAQILPVLVQNTPGLGPAIQENPEEFMRLLQEGAGVGGGGGGETDPVAAAIAAAQMGGGPAPGMPGGPQVVRLTEEERAAVERLAALGFDPQMAAQAYLACDKNEELAANFLFENGGNDMDD